jgi:holo-[acyl-carrier protein] synthase
VIVGVGIDLLEVRRVEQELARGEWQQGEGIFSPDEIRYCSAFRRPALRYAACFAAKEAVLKALGLQVNDLALFREVEVGLDTNSIALHQRLQTRSEQLGVRIIRLSTTVGKDLTGAMVILEH